MIEATNFDRRIDKETALELIKPWGQSALYERIGCDVMCKEYGDDEDWVGLQSDDYEMIKDSPEYQTFELWFNIKR